MEMTIKRKSAIHFEWYHLVDKTVWKPVKWVFIGSGNCLSPGRFQVITFASDDVLPTGP